VFLILVAVWCSRSPHGFLCRGRYLRFFNCPNCWHYYNFYSPKRRL